MSAQPTAAPASAQDKLAVNGKVKSNVNLGDLRQKFVAFYKSNGYRIITWSDDARREFEQLRLTLTYHGHRFEYLPVEDEWYVESLRGTVNWGPAKPDDYFTFQ